MRVVHISVTDKGNGAHLAGFRLHQGLRRLGIDSSMFIQRRLDDSEDETIGVYKRSMSLRSRAKRFAYRRWISRELAGCKQRQDGLHFYHDRAPEGRDAISQIPAADVIYIHSVYGFIEYFRDLPILAQRAPVVRVLHDMNFFTGGCSHDRGCGRFTDRCGTCPLLLSHSERDLSRRTWERKRAVFPRIRDRLYALAPSQWIADQARRSSLLRNVPIEVIPNTVDTDAFRLRKQSAMREFCEIPQEARVVAFLSDPLDRVLKGFPLLIKALMSIKNVPNLFLLTGGGGKPPVPIGIPHRHLGKIHDERSLCAFYSAADIVVIPSLEDNLPSVAMEAMACRKCVVAFATGGIPEMVRHGVTGLVVPKADTEALGNAIANLLNDSSARARMSENGRRIAVEEYSLAVVAKRHADLCARITSSPEIAMRSGSHEEVHILVGKE